MSIHLTAIVTSVQLISSIICSASESVGDAVYFSTNDTVTRASASSINTAKVCGFIDSKQSATECTIRVGGLLEKSGLTANNKYFLSTTLGAVSSTPPTGSGQVVVQLGLAKSATSLLVEISSNRLIKA